MATTLPLNSDTSAYAILTQEQSTGVSGVPSACDAIELGELAAGDLRESRYRAKRCPGSDYALGLDFFQKLTIQLDLKRGVLNVLSCGHRGGKLHPLIRRTKSHLTMNASVGAHDIRVLFDTGADATLMDLDFLNTHRELFHKAAGREQDGRDANGNFVPSEVYKVHSFRVGELGLDGLEIVAIPFAAHMKLALGLETPIILGTNALIKGVWTVDLERSVWSVEDAH